MITPAEVWPVGHFIEEELRERAWTRLELLKRLRGGSERAFELCLLLDAPTRGVMLDKDLAEGLGKVFGTSTEFWINIDKTWQDDDNAGPTTT